MSQPILLCGFIKVMKKGLYLAFFVVLILSGYRYRYFISAFVNETFISHEYTLPEAGGEFIVRSEYVPVRPFIKHVIGFAFPEYKIIFDNTKKPNLILRSVYRDRGSNLFEQLKYNAPYISISAEKGQMKTRRYRSTGYPFFEFVSYKSNQDNLAYIPMAAYHKNNLYFLNTKKRSLIPLEVIKARGNVAYIFRHCVPIREELFQLLEKSIPAVHAYGKCSKNVDGEYPKDVQEVYNKYNFVVAMENAQKDGYITEKIVNAYEANSIPIYWGSSDLAKKYFNPKSFIDVSDFPDLESAVAHIKLLSESPEKIQEMLAEPILTEEGEKELTINNETLNPESEKKLKEIAAKFRQYYLQKINQKTVVERYRS